MSRDDLLGQLTKLNLAENPALEPLERPGWTYVPSEELAATRLAVE